ncbi:unnamed protein product [Caenorhabditis auriculariae]|uniref:Cytochrome b5 heme-binding domain-containing protein n=1 Tax=Caenorhabditis auriculariae TaxID=2777116 RepID=A0A8S1HH21_9PELO|nr:unnamed protein product [Caenorhabditis auriculariae]
MTKYFSANEVARHCTHDDLWIIYGNKVYDLTPYYKEHPGGTALLRYAGKNATSALPMVNSHGIAWNFITKKLEECQIGILK